MDEETTSVDEIVVNMMRQMGCCCGATPVIEAALFTANGPSHVEAKLRFHFDHAPACVATQFATMDLN